MPDDRPSGPRRYVPVPGLPDLDTLADDDAPDPFALPDPPPLPEPETTDDGLKITGRATAPPLPRGEGQGEGSPTAGGRPEPDSDSGPSASTTDLSDGTTDPSVDTTGLADSATPPPDDAPATDPEAPRAPVPAPPAEPGEAPSRRPDPPARPSPSPPTTPQEPGDALPERVVDPVARPVVPSPIVETAKSVTKDRGRELVQLVVRYGKDHLPEEAPREAVPDTGPPRMVGRVGQLIPFLRVIPYGLAVLFVASFWWDFPGMSVRVLGQELAVDGLMRVLTVSGLIGFGTNWLAITMLFQPRQKRAIIPQGLIPAQRERVIYRLSEAISRELINADIIKQRIQESGVIGRYRDLALGVVRGVVEDPSFRTDLKRLAQDYAQEVLGSEPVRREVARLAVEKVEQQAGGGIGGVALRLYRTFAEDDFQRRVDRALDELPDAVAPLLDRIDHALDAVPAKVEARADEIEEAATTAVLSFVEGFDVRTMISERARQFDEGQLEGLLKSTSNEQLNYIKYLGAILGVVGGFVIWQPIGALAVLASLSLLLWGVDEALVRARKTE
ncbi:DUF445 domain-containing protein [Rubrivirga sp. IMCC43871]|uniref:DUF445 domain-containing protein n=1 Tax=Rubrivirga sp. IMCC43871 TaxID=3391575 RepID=UPI00398F9E74